MIQYNLRKHTASLKQTWWSFLIFRRSRSYHIDFSSSYKCQHSQPGGGSTMSRSLRIRQYMKPINPTCTLWAQSGASENAFKPQSSWTACLRRFLSNEPSPGEVNRKGWFRTGHAGVPLGRDVNGNFIRTYFADLRERAAFRQTAYNSDSSMVPIKSLINYWGKLILWMTSLLSFSIHIYITVKQILLFCVTWFSFTVIQSMPACNYSMWLWSGRRRWHFLQTGSLFCSAMTWQRSTEGHYKCADLFMNAEV